MKANELRIGNCYNYRYFDFIEDMQEWLIMTTVDADDLKWLEANPNDPYYEPIPLTEEWLLKFGVLCPFMLDSEKSFVSNLVAKYNEFDEDWNYVVDSCLHATTGGIMYISVVVKYVHQLQNIYFALTGEELTIKEESK